MLNNEKWIINEDEKDQLIMKLSPELATLRAKAGISQDELSSLIGVSRQTYGAIERMTRKMSWNTYLSIILFYDYNEKTHQFIRSIGAFPHEMVKRFNDGTSMPSLDIYKIIGENAENIMECLDEQALMSIRTIIMLEYARCTSTPGEVVVKSFDGVQFQNQTITSKNIEAQKALKKLKESE